MNTYSIKSYTLLLTITFSILLHSCAKVSFNEPSDVIKINLQDYVKSYGSGRLTPTKVDGVLLLNSGMSYDVITTTNKWESASAQAVIVDPNGIPLNNAGVSCNSSPLNNPYSTFLLGGFVNPPAQTANSINWQITGLGSSTINVQDNPLQQILITGGTKAGDTVSKSGFTITYSGDTSIANVSVTLIYDTGFSSSSLFLGDTKTSDIPPPIEKCTPNNGSITFNSSELISFKKGYYLLVINYFALDLYTNAGRKFYLAKSYTTDIPLLIP